MKIEAIENEKALTDSNLSVSQEFGASFISFNSEHVDKFLEIASEVEKRPSPVMHSIENGKVTRFDPKNSVLNVNDFEFCI